METTSKNSITPEAFARWAMLHKWCITTAERRELTKKMKHLLALKLVSDDQLSQYKSLRKGHI